MEQTIGQQAPRRRRRRVALLSTMVVIAAAAVSAASIPPATADPVIVAPGLPSLTGVVLVEKLSPANSSNKSVTVSCPSGKKVIGSGGSIVSGGRQVILDDMYPNDALTNVTATGLEADSYAGTWQVRAAATCANPVSGMQRVRAVVSNSDSAKSATATCPSGRTVLGTGASIQGGQGQAALRFIRPQGGGAASAASGVTVGAYETDPLAGSWSVLAYAICASPVAGQKTRNDTSTVTSNSTSGQVVYCESSQVATGGGGQLFDTSGAVTLNTVTPANAGATVVPRGIVALAAKEDASSSAWAVRAWVLCANGSQ